MGDLPLSVIGITEPTSGVAVLNPYGTVTYIPTGAFSGNDMFDYTIADSKGGIKTATVTVQVAPIANPVAVADSTSTLSVPVTPRVIHLLASDSDPDGDALTLVSFTQPLSGKVTCTPVAGFKWKATFTYVLADSYGGTDTGTVSVTASTSGSPIAVSDSASTGKDTTMTMTVLANDSDPDGDPLTVMSVTQPTNGTATINPNGTVPSRPLRVSRAKPDLTTPSQTAREARTLRQSP